MQHKPGFVFTVTYDPNLEQYYYDLKFNNPTFYDLYGYDHIYGTSFDNPLNFWNPADLPSGLFTNNNIDWNSDWPKILI